MVLVIQHTCECRSRSRIVGKWTRIEIKLRNASAKLRPPPPGLSHSELACERASGLRRRISWTGRKDDRNGGEREKRRGQTEDGWWRLWMARSSYRYDKRKGWEGGREGGEGEEEDLRGWTCQGGDSFFRFYRKKRVALRARNGVRARIRRAHASRARGFSSHPRPTPNVSPPAIFSLFHLRPTRTCKLTDRHWIPSYTSTLLHKLHDQ